MISDIIIMGIIVFKFPGWEWLGVIICLLKHILKAIVLSGATHKKQDDVPFTEYDEFDWWQDNQGL